MRTLTVVARSANDSAERTRPNSSARGAGTRPDATGRAAVRSPISRSMSRSITWLSALAPPHASARPSEHRRELDAAGPAARADEHPGGSGQEQQRHDPRLRQRHVVAPRPERERLAAERDGERHERRGQRRAGGGDVDDDRPASRRPSTRRARRSRSREHQHERHAPPARTSRGYASDRRDEDADEERKRDERGAPVRAAELERRARDDRAGRDRRRDDGEPEERPGCPVAPHAAGLRVAQPAAQVVQRPRARDVRHVVEVVRRRRRGRVPLERVAPATGRCPRAGR